MKWNVMKLCKAQLMDVNPDDVLCDGLYRKCNTYKGGGGYDKFPEIYQNRFGKTENLNDQFVVQLRGCPLNCPYCYVTRDGVLTGECHQVSTEQMVGAFNESGCSVFHLMGGAPAIYIDNWADILSKIEGKVFHSDLLLVEGAYNSDIIAELATFKQSLYAVSVKGGTVEEFYKNTGTPFNDCMQRWFWSNLDLIVSKELPFYFTFTGMSESSINNFKEQVINRYGDPTLLNDSFAIDIIHYNALDYTP